jgi:AcrR family transcriptional regulator
MPTSKQSIPKVKASMTRREQSSEANRANIIDVATRIFAEHGLAGARMDLIAKEMHTTKPMIYYYFGNKEDLYIAVLEEAYRRIRNIEATLHLDELDPESALRKLVDFTVRYQYQHPEFVRLVLTENINRGAYLAKSKVIHKLNTPAIDAVEQIYKRGLKEKIFRPGIDPIDLHMTISGLSVFNVSNKHTFSYIFKRDLDSKGAFDIRCANIVELILRYVKN